MLWKYLKTLRWPPRRLVLWHTIAAIPLATVVIVGAYLSYHYHQLADENRARVDRAYQVLDVVDGLYISVQDADVAERDYIITGDDAHLGEFQAALRAESEDSKKLRQLLADSRSQEANLAGIDVAVAAKLSELSRTIALRQQKGFEAARQAIPSGNDGQAMASLRQQVVMLAQSERRFLMRRQAAGREHERNAVLAGLFIAVLSVVVRLLIALGIRHVHARRQAALVEDDAGAETPTPAAGAEPAAAG